MVVPTATELVPALGVLQALAPNSSASLCTHFSAELVYSQNVPTPAFCPSEQQICVLQSQSSQVMACQVLQPNQASGSAAGDVVEEMSRANVQAAVAAFTFLGVILPSDHATRNHVCKSWEEQGSSQPIPYIALTDWISPRWLLFGSVRCAV